MASASDGKVKVIAKGDFVSWSVAPGQDRVAALRVYPRQPLPNVVVSNGADGSRKRELSIIDITSEKAIEKRPCKVCDVLRHSLLWSADGNSVLMIARKKDDSWEKAGLWRYDHLTERLSEIKLGNIKVYADEAILTVARYVWLEDKIGVFATEQPKDQEAEPSAPSWYLVSDDKSPENLSEKFADPRLDVVGYVQNRIFVSTKGEVWELYSDGTSNSLTRLIEEPVSVLSASLSIFNWTGPTTAAQNPITTQLTLVADKKIDSGSGSHRKHYYILDTADGTFKETADIESEERVMAIDAVTGTALLHKERGSEELIFLRAPNGESDSILSINKSYPKFDGPKVKKLEHKSVSGEDRVSWIALPPNWRPGSRLPVVVDAYLGWPGDLKGRANNANTRILVSEGFAVLFPDLPTDYTVVPRDPMLGLADEVLKAVDAAIDAGIADPDRLGIQGSSYGAYTAVSVISQTSRFSAAIASSGIYDLVSMYGVIGLRDRMDADYYGLDLSSVKQLETYQLGMGSAPWVDPERYLRNSPLMRVQEIDTPIMIVHGDLDAIPITQAEELFTALYRQNKDAVFVRYWGEDHFINSAANIRDNWSRTLKWFHDNLDD